MAGYDRGLYTGLSQIAGVDVRLTTPDTLAIPGTHLLQKCTGLDLQRFLDTFPVRPLNGSFDIFHLTSQTLASVLWWRPRQPVVVTVHDIFPYLFRNDSHLGIYGHAIHRAFDIGAVHLLKRASAIITDCTAVRDDLRRELRLRSPIFVVPLGVDHSLFRVAEVPPDFWRRHGLSPDRPTVLHISSDDPRKNIETLLRAWPNVIRALPSAVLVKAGRSQFPDQRRRLDDLVLRLGVQDSVQFLDSASELDLVHLYNAADVFAFPSIAEGFGFPVLEAMACGTPVVCSDIGALRELADDAGTFVPARDPDALSAALLRVLQDDGVHDRLRRAALVRAAAYNWERTAAATTRVYAEVLGRT